MSDIKLDLDSLDQETEEETGFQGEGEVEEYSDIELEAMKHGWTPDGVEGKKNLTAEEFMDRKPLYDDLKSQKKKIKQLQEGVEALRQHNATIAERERAKIISELKRAKAKALEAENYEAVVEIDDRLAEEKANATAAQQPISTEAFENFLENNSWYNQDPEMRQFADEVGTGHFQNNPNKPLEEVYAYVEKRVKKAFPEKFAAPARERPSPVEGASKGRAGSGKKYSVKDLPAEHRQIMQSIVRTGAMTEQEYLKQYFDN